MRSCSNHYPHGSALIRSSSYIMMGLAVVVWIAACCCNNFVVDAFTIMITPPPAVLHYSTTTSASTNGNNGVPNKYLNNNNNSHRRTIPTTRLSVSSSSRQSGKDDDSRGTNVYVNGQPTLTPPPSDDPALVIMDCMVQDDNSVWKNQLFNYAASYDRGFGASTSARENVLALVQQLESVNVATNVMNSILTTSTTTSTPMPNYSVKYNWRMIWTTAIDVLSLQASPFFSVGAIYQCFAPIATTKTKSTLLESDSDNKKDVVITNIIDFIPRIQSLIPPSILPNTLVRVNVKTIAKKPPRINGDTKNNRIGLIFDAVTIEPIELLGLPITIFPPIGFNLPKFNIPNNLVSQVSQLLSGFGLVNGDINDNDDNSDGIIGFFDVTYLDDDLLIIRQNTIGGNNGGGIGGLFVLSKVNSIDP